jgi:hypothetical protein
VSQYNATRRCYTRDIRTAPDELDAFLKTQDSAESAWANCTRADWLFWLAQPRITDDRQRRKLVGAVALALGISEYRNVSRRAIRLAWAWANQDFDDPDPTGFVATIVSLCVGGAVGIAVELWLYFRSDHPIRGTNREVYSFPVFLVLSALVRVIARPLLRRRWVSKVRGYTFERAERDLFPKLAKSVARSGDTRRAMMADSFRKRMEWSR